MTNIKHVNSVVDREFRNRINQLIDSINAQGKSIQDLVANGQLTDEQYAELITAINGHLKSGEVDRDALNSTLRTEIDKIRDKIDRGDVSVYDINKNKGKIDQTFLTQGLIDAITGSPGANVLSEVAPGSVTEDKMAPKAVTPRKTSFFDVSNNLFDSSKLLENTSISPSGDVIEEPGRWLSDYIEVPQEKKLSIKKASYRIAVFDENKTFIKRIVTTPSSFIDMTSETRDKIFIRLSGTTDTSDLMLNTGGTLLTYEPYFVTLPNSFLPEIEKGKMPELTLDDLGDLNGAISSDMTDFIKQSTNLVNPEEIVRNKTIDRQTGKLTDSIISNTSGFIRVLPSTNYTAKAWRCAFYDDNKIYISSIGSDPTQPRTFTTPLNASYVRVAFHNGDLGKQQLNEGSTLLPYESYGGTLDPKIKVEQSSDTNNTRKYFLNTDYVPDYYLPNDNENFGMMSNAATTTPYSEYTSNWQSLANAHSDYLTMSKIGEDESGQYNIYKISAKPTEVASPTTKERIKIIFITGIHGGEKAAQFATYYFFKDICENWMENEALEFLRWNVHFEFIVCASPWAFENGNGRTNSKGVDINRNFIDSWKEGEVGSNTYGGTSPLSESEAQIIKAFVDENSDAVYFGDYHNHYNQDQAGMMWLSTAENAVGNDLIFDWGSTTIRKCSLHFHKRYGFPYIESGMGHISQRSSKSPIATASSYARSINMPACTFEAFNTLDISSGFEETIKACTEYTGNYFLNIMRVMTQKYYK